MPESVTGSGPSLGAALRSALAQVSLGRARPSYNRKSPLAQFRQLQRTEAGRRALGLAGVSVSDRTTRRWLGRQQSPSKANAEKISRAYGAARRGGIPEWVKRGDTTITGSVAYGEDTRTRGEGGYAPLLIEKGPAGRWARIEDEWPELDDDELEELFAGDVIEDAIGNSYPWGFPGSSYSISFVG